jgi:hypothetical protein
MGSDDRIVDGREPDEKRKGRRRKRLKMRLRERAS